MKYIDAEKLIAAIEKRLKNIRDYINGTGMKYKGPKFYKARGKESAYDELLSIIYFLQQEQSRWRPSKDEITTIEVALKFLLAHTSDEQLRKNVISVFENLKQL